MKKRLGAVSAAMLEKIEHNRRVTGLFIRDIALTQLHGKLTGAEGGEVVFGVNEAVGGTD